MRRLTRDATAGPVSRDQILRRERGRGNIHFPCSADHEQDWQPYPVDSYSCYICVTIDPYIPSHSTVIVNVLVSVYDVDVATSCCTGTFRRQV